MLGNFFLFIGAKHVCPDLLDEKQKSFKLKMWLTASKMFAKLSVNQYD